MKSDLKQCIVGFDFGTTSLSAIVFNTLENKIEKVFNYNTNAYIYFDDELKKEQSLDIILDLFQNCLDQIKRISGIHLIGYTFTGQMHGIIGLNSNGEAVTNLVTWQDRSGDIVISDGVTILEEMRKTTDIKSLATGYGIVTLYKWIKYDKRTDIHSFCTAPDYFARYLLNRKDKVEITPTMAHSIGLYDLYSDKWQKDLIEKIGLNNIVFPSIVEESHPIGHITKEDSSSIPVFCAIGDNQASFRGSVVDKKHTILLNVGTGTQLSLLINKSEIAKYDKYIDGSDTQIRPYNSQYYLLATSFVNGGSVYKSLFSFFKDVATNLFGINNIDDSLLWKQMMNLGKNSLDCSNLLNISPLLEGSRKDPTAGGCISNLHTSNFTAGAFIVGFLEGLAKYYQSGLFPEFRDFVTSISASGNGLKRNPLFCSIIESIFGYPLKLTPYDEEASLGAIANAYNKLIGVSEDLLLSKLNFS